MPVVTVVPSIEPYYTPQGGYELRLRSVATRQAWMKWYETEPNAYEDAVNLGVATLESGGAHGVLAAFHRRLKVDASIDLERLVLFGLRETVF